MAAPEMSINDRVRALLDDMSGRYKANPPSAAFFPLDTALSLGIDVGNAPNVAMTSSGVVLVSDKPFDEAEAKRFAALVDMDGDVIYLPPFKFERRAPSRDKGGGA